jgi:hypothetical protein
MPVEYTHAPKRLTYLLQYIPSTFPFYISCRTEDGTSPRGYLNQNDTGEPVQASAVLAETYSAALFSDGTAYFTGSLPDRYVISGGTVLAFRLPKLPDGFTYGDFAICGQTLYAAWEESDFYLTGRSGFIAVNLDNVLYRH